MMNPGQNAGKSGANRILWVDAAKGVGIVLIVLGHILRGGELNTVLYAFHVPLFFFLSGVTFHKHRKPVGDVLQDLLTTRMLPYFLWGILSILIFAFVSRFVAVDLFDARGEMSIVGSLKYLLLGYCFENSVLWFLPCLAVAELLLYVVLRVHSSIKDRRGKMAWLLLTTAAALAVLLLNQQFFKGQRWIFNAATAFAMYPIMLLGWLLGQSGLLKREVSMPTALAIALPCIAAGALLALKGNSQIVYMSSSYGNVAVFYLAVLLLISGATLICKKMETWGLRMVGTKTMGIMLMHRFPVTLFLILPYVKHSATQRRCSLCWRW